MSRIFKKIGGGLLYLALFVLIGSLILLSFCGDNASRHTNSAKSDILRVHIIANSNSQEDMDIKYSARESMFAFFEKNSDEIHTKVEMIQFIESNKEQLSMAIEESLTVSGADYGVSVNIAEEEFPIRMYGDTLVPEGDYDAVVITLGEGNGDNWWCVAFPSFCVTKKAQDQEKVVVKSRIAEFVEKIVTFFKEL